MKPIPVTLLTGFLGSGKTTLLSRVIRDARFSDTAVIINEFGEIALDHVLVETSYDDLVQTTSGCLCCTIRGDIRKTLRALHARMEAGSIPTFNRVIIETTGLADPAPVLHTLIADADIWSRFGLSGVVTTVDAVNGELTLDRQIESVKQVAVADRLVLTKTDLAADPGSRRDLATLNAALRQLNPGAVILDPTDATFDLRSLFDTTAYNPATKRIDVGRWLNDEAIRAAEEDAQHDHGGHGDDGEHGHHHHHHHDDAAEAQHDINRHGEDIFAFCITRDEPVPSMAFARALELLIATRGEDLLRVKGIVHVAERPDTPCIIHGVQHIFHKPTWLRSWPDADRRTRIVFITRNLPRDVVEPVIAGLSGETIGQTSLEPSA